MWVQRGESCFPRKGEQGINRESTRRPHSVRSGHSLFRLLYRSQMAVTHTAIGVSSDIKPYYRGAFGGPPPADRLHGAPAPSALPPPTPLLRYYLLATPLSGLRPLSRVAPGPAPCPDTWAAVVCVWCDRCVYGFIIISLYAERDQAPRPAATDRPRRH